MAKIQDKGHAGAKPVKKKSGSAAKPLAAAAILLAMMVVVFNPGRTFRNKKNNQDKVVATSIPAEPGFVKQGELSFQKSDGSLLAKIDIELADDEAEREKGLMFRRQMEMNQGMLFIFDDEDQRSFWMKNTYIPLDILYINGQNKILRIHENCATLNEQPIPSDFPARYVVEVNAGFCALNRIEVGDFITFVKK